MIIPKMLINAVANKLVKHFKLDKIVNYVFEDNELDNKTKELENRIKIIESIIVVNNNKGENMIVIITIITRGIMKVSLPLTQKLGIKLLQKVRQTLMMIIQYLEHNYLLILLGDGDQKF